jgi:hypothetical protein
MADPEDQRMQQEVADLWSATFGEMPAIEADPQTMIRILVACLKDPGPFQFGGPPTSAAGEPASDAEAPSRPRLGEPAQLGV